MSFSSMDGGGDDDDNRYPFSKINAREAMITVDALYDFLKDYWPQSHRTRVHVNRPGPAVPADAERSGQPAQAAVRNRGSEGEILGAAVGQGQARNTSKEANLLLDRWSRASLLQMCNPAPQAQANGLDAVDRDRAKWHTAQRKMELVEELAAKLSASAHEYFECRLEQYQDRTRTGRGPGPGHPRGRLTATSSSRFRTARPNRPRSWKQRPGPSRRLSTCAYRTHPRKTLTGSTTSAWRAHPPWGAGNPAPGGGPDGTMEGGDQCRKLTGTRNSACT